MENPEEVLQALDEFQKMRPSEIPRELEDYLCWVARTGDPVYQWSLVKALFREKLMRVMTEFYESCPTLDLTPCPNVEQFNYDIMKRNLLERLESFANAPFTVQRICELLTTPRKEYNRIDKFMRAIEKNILVVSTREPGPYGRRSENGDSLVNGSVEDETSHHGQTSNEVEMDWVEDCTATAAVPAHGGESEEMSVGNGLNSSIKTSFEKQERTEQQLPAVDATASSFVTSSTDFSTATSATIQVPAQEPTAVVQKLTTINHEAATIVGDVSDAIINEDTSSQPSLELESDDNDSNDSKKLQTTFEAKDFSVDEEKSPKSYSEPVKDNKPEESTKITETTESTESSKEVNQLVQLTYSNEKLLNENVDDLQSSDKTNNLEAHSTANETDQADNKPIETELQASEKSEPEPNINVDNTPLVNNDLDVEKTNSQNDTADSSETLVKAKCDIDETEESKTEPVKEKEPDTTESTESTENFSKEEPLKEVEPEAPSDVSKPIIEEPLLETTDSSETTKTKSTELTIEESTEEETKTDKSIVPDSIPIIEEPKDTESAAKDWDSSVSITEVSSEPKEDVAAIKNGFDEAPVISEQVDDNQMIATSCKEPQSKKAVSELMDVDNEGLTLSVQQHESMEQETAEPMNS